MQAGEQAADAVAELGGLAQPDGRQNRPIPADIEVIVRGQAQPAGRESVGVGLPPL